MVDDIKYFLNNDQDSLKNEILGESLYIGNSIYHIIFKNHLQYIRIKF